jgi:hypothetical protein
MAFGDHFLVRTIITILGKSNKANGLLFFCTVKNDVMKRLELLSI